MTFQLTLDEWMEGRRIYGRSQSPFQRLLRLFPVLFCFVTFGLIVTQNPSLSDFVPFGICVVWALHLFVWVPLRIPAKFRQQFGGNVTPPITYEFSVEGFRTYSDEEETRVLWENVASRSEGPNVWVFEIHARPMMLLVIPKRAIQTEEGQREWAIVDAHFAPPSDAPIAPPH